MEKHEIIIYEQRCELTLLNISEVSRFVGIHPDMIYRFFQLGLVDPQVETPEPLFDDSVIVRIEKILRLKNELGVNLDGCGLVLDLLDRIAVLEKQILHYEMKNTEQVF